MTVRRIGRVLCTGLCLALPLASCGGGGGSAALPGAGEATALTVAEKVSVVDAQSGGTESPAGPAASPLAAPRPLAVPTDPDSDYVKDRANVYVAERSVESFNTVNEILCMMAQTGYSAMMNQGPYTALVDTKLCAGKDSASAGGQQSANQSSGANMPVYEMWTVDSSRADDASPHVVKVWVHESAGEMEPEKLIYARANITEGVSDSNPYGIFTLNFEGHPAPGGVPAPQVIFKGVLKAERDAGTGEVLLKFFNGGGFSIPGEGEVSFTEKALLNRNVEGSGGTGTLYNQESSPWGTRSAAFDIAFNDNNFLRDDGTNSACLDRKEFDSSAWRYGLYNASGARVNRSSGFPVTVTRDGTSYHGYIGYWGAWFPNDLALLDGETVTRQTFGGGGGTPEQFTVAVRGGKLRKHTRRVLELGDVVNVPLDYNEFDPDAGPGDQFRVLWNGTNFRKVAVMDKTNWTWQRLQDPVVFDLDSLRHPELFFWSQSLGGSVQVKLQECVPDFGDPNDPMDDTFSCSADNVTPVISYAETTVSPSETIPGTLACFENCPDAAKVTASDPFPFVDNVSGFQPVPPTDPDLDYKGYTFSGMLLRDDGTAVVATGDVYNWGLMSGPLFDPTEENLGLLQCDFDNNATCGWQARSNLPVYYTWETGPNSWNRLTALQKADSSFVAFDPPLSIEYVHNGNGYANARFFLQYNGFGDLHGIPGKCVDMETGEDSDCSEGGPGSFIRWVPEFTIPDGSEATSGGTGYYIKALELEQRMKTVAGSVCTDAGLATTSYVSQLPTLADWTAPDIGAEPSVADAPAVIGGNVQ